VSEANRRIPPGVPYKFLRLHKIFDVLHFTGFIGGGTVVGLSGLREKVRVHLGEAEFQRLLMLSVDPLRVIAGGDCNLRVPKLRGDVAQWDLAREEQANRRVYVTGILKRRSYRAPESPAKSGTFIRRFSRTKKLRFHLRDGCKMVSSNQ